MRKCLAHGIPPSPAVLHEQLHIPVGVRRNGASDFVRGTVAAVPLDKDDFNVVAEPR